MCAALAAEEAGASVLVIERAPKELRGGNSAFTAGAMRVAYRGVEDIQALVPDLSPEQLAITEFGRYTVDQYYDDLGRTSEYRTDPELAHALASDSLETLLSLTATQPGMSEGIGTDADGLARGAVDDHGGRLRWFGEQR